METRGCARAACSQVPQASRERGTRGRLTLDTGERCGPSTGDAGSSQRGRGVRTWTLCATYLCGVSSAVNKMRSPCGRRGRGRGDSGSLPASLGRLSPVRRSPRNRAELTGLQALHAHRTLSPAWPSCSVLLTTVGKFLHLNDERMSHSTKI